MKMMTPRKVCGLGLSIIGIVLAAFGGGVAGVLLIAAMHPGVKGPHVRDNQMVGAFILGALIAGAVVAGLLIFWFRRSHSAK
jgi:hypothetical protein